MGLVGESIFCWSALILFFAFMGSAQAACPECGDTINVSITLTCNLIDCEADGLVIGADYVTIDGAGHTISGSDHMVGVYATGRTGVTVRNLVIRNFNQGILLYLCPNSMVIDNTAANNTNNGIWVSDSPGNMISYNTANRNEGSGIYLSNATYSTVSSNTANSNILNGIELTDHSDNNTITDNVADYNGNSGIKMTNSVENTVTGNTACGNGWDGIHLLNFAHQNTVTKNTACENDRAGIYSSRSHDNDLLQNTLQSNSYGIYSYSSNNTLEVNGLYGNNVSGVYLRESNWTVIGNYICYNTQDFSTTGWLSSWGDNNSCDNPDGWNDQGAGGCTSSCSDVVWTKTSSGKASFSVNAGIISSLSAVSESSLPSIEGPPLSFPHGLFAINVSGLALGETVTINITLPQNVPAGTKYFKYGATSDNSTPRWYELAVGSDNGDNIISVDLTDGGLGDMDATVNGVIVDPGGPAIAGDCECVGETLNFSCGETVNESCTMNCDMQSNGTCFTFGTDAVSIDCGGYSISGNGSGEGVVIANADNCSVRNCSITGFGTGVSLGPFTGNNTLSGNTIEGNEYGMSFIYDSNGNTVVGNTVSLNGNGIHLCSSSENNVSNNTVSSNDQTGLYFCESSTGNSAYFNTICGNNVEGGAYFDVFDGDSNLGGGNTCDFTSNWSDTGETGCTNLCPSQALSYILETGWNLISIPMTA